MGFISGGFLPASLYGKTHDGVIHVADFYPTLCNLAGVADCTDNKTFLGKVRPIGASRVGNQGDQYFTVQICNACCMINRMPVSAYVQMAMTCGL